MKIIRYNKTNVPQREPGKPSIYIHSGGNFCLNEPLAIKLGIPDNDDVYYVELIQDEENPKDWFITLADEQTGFKLRREKDCRKYNFNTGVVAKAILKCLKTPNNLPPNTATLTIAVESVEFDGNHLWPIITSSYKAKN